MTVHAASSGAKMSVLKHRAAVAGSTSQRAVATDRPERRKAAALRRVTAVAVLALVVLIVAVVLTVAAAATPALPPLTAAILGAVVVATFLLGAHAGGHGWFVPLPAAVLAALWALLASSGHATGALAWLLAATALVACATGIAAVVPAIGARRLGGSRRHIPAGGTEGVAVTDLDMIGVVRVGGETWTAESLSGPLPAGTSVRVVAVRGLRLQVWSEQGTVPGPDALEGPKEHQ